MQKQIYRKTLDMQKSGSQWSVTVKNTDAESRQIIFTVTDGGNPFYLQDNISVVIFAKKPDGTILYNDCTVQDGRAVYDITTQTISAAGSVECELRLLNGSQLITSPSFTIESEQVIGNDSAIESTNEYSALTNSAAKTIIAAESAETAAETAQNVADMLTEKLNAGEFKGEKGDRGEPGPQGEKGEQGEIGPQGEKGEDGATFIPDVSSEGILSWSNDNKLENPAPINLRAPMQSIDLSSSVDISTLDGVYEVIAAGKLTNSNGAELSLSVGAIINTDSTSASVTVLTSTGSYELNKTAVDWSNSFCITADDAKSIKDLSIPLGKLENAEVKNIIADVQINEGCWLNNNHTVSGNSTTWDLTDLITEGIVSEGEYYFTAFDFDDYNTGYRVIVYCYDADGTYLGTAATDTGNAAQFKNTAPQSKYFKLLENTASIRIQIYQTLRPYSDIQFVLVSNFRSGEYLNKYELPYALNKAVCEQIEKIKCDSQQMFVEKNGTGQVTVKNCEFAERTVNLLTDDISWQEGITLNVSASTGKVSIQTGSDTWSLSTSFAVKPNTTYAFKAFDNIVDGTNQIGYILHIWCFDENGNCLGDVASSNSTGGVNSFSAEKAKIFTTAENTAYCCLQIYTSILQSCKELLLSEKEELPDSYVSPYVLPFQPSSKMSEYATKSEMSEYVSEKISEIDAESETTVISTGSGQYDWFYANCVKDAEKMLDRLNNTANVYHDMVNSEYNLMQDGDVYQHDASIVYYNAKIYVFYVNNQVDTGDNASNKNAFVRLDKLAINTSSALITGTDSSAVVCKYGDVVDGITVISGCGQPNMVLKDGILYMFWSSKGNDGIWYEMYCTYDCSADTLGTPHICNLGTGLFNCEAIGNYAGVEGLNTLISMNASIALLNGSYYACACILNYIPNGVILKSSDLINWEFLSVPVFEGYTPSAQFEGALGAFADNLYLALRQADLDSSAEMNPIVLAKLNADGEVLDYCLLPSGTSRPSFFNRGTAQLYLCASSNNRTNTMCLDVTSALRDAYPVFDFAVGGNYLAVCAKSTTVFYTVRTQGTLGLRVGLWHRQNMNTGVANFYNAMTSSE